MFDKGVLTIQTWIDKAANAAVGAAIVKQEDINEQEEQALAERLIKLTEKEINTRVLNKMGAKAVGELEAAARASSADTKLYKVFQLVSTLSRAERVTLLRDKRSVLRVLV